MKLSTLYMLYYRCLGIFDFMRLTDDNCDALQS
jgi:hypothetical protein